ncbi:endonuclease/exonuclease/phosphatase family protein [Allorhodopirellula solitaria]|uniref:Endonuclease/exonuclease/phosphatase domain-containing protein n=1 Tax=Allorhodopirellula solitaria TaxID=2527987 RepID=A0A5C5YER9_9BACT|nr:endonuclease/exonuclease/phosphatase family protein [Allorhodopirellula solitaria]TWT74256.1 hypothetical protein CA85_11430 [Allorhodopirellula solitaria]
MKSLRFSLAIVVAAIATVTPLTLQAEDASPAHRVVSYNIKHGLGNDGKLDLARTAEVIRKLQPDLVALQEVDRGTQRSEGVDQPADLAKRLGMQSAFGAFMDYDGGQYGLAVLSRYPIVKTDVVRLPQGNEPRVALAVEVELPNGDALTVVDVHFDWVKDDSFRLSQAQKLSEYLDSLTTSYVLMGDFNDRPQSATVQLFRDRALEAQKPADDHLTFSSNKPSIEIDFIFAAPKSKWKFENVDVIDEPVASDHRPIVAELQSR